MARTPKYNEAGIRKDVRLTPSTIDVYQQYAEQLETTFSDLLEQIARNPSVARGFAAFVESQKKFLRIA